MSDDQARRFAGIAGLVGVVLYVVTAVLIVDLPGISTSAPELVKYVTSHQTQLLLEVFTWGATVAVTMVFLAGFWQVLRRAGEGVEMLATLGLIGGVAVDAVVMAGFGSVLTLGYRASSLTPAEVKLLFDQTLVGTTLSAFVTTISLVGFSLAVLRSRVLPAWVAWLGILVGLVHIVAAGSLAQDGLFSPSGVPIYVAPVLYFLWILVVSAYLLRSPRVVAKAA